MRKTACRSEDKKKQKKKKSSRAQNALSIYNIVVYIDAVIDTDNTYLYKKKRKREKVKGR